MAAQDDAREREMRTLFNLKRKDGAGRSDEDALLELRGAAIPPEFQGMTIDFELKSATRGQPNVSTVRDMGLHHIEKWRRLHWIIGVYDRNPSGDQELQYCLYGSPQKMAPWFDAKAEYIAPDVALGECVPALLTDDTLTSILGPEDRFAIDDARRLMKNQMSAEEYRAAADLPGGQYSRAAMLRLLRTRLAYIIGRGSTLNNPHIPASYFAGWERITEDHAARLRELVVESLREGGGGQELVAA